MANRWETVTDFIFGVPKSLQMVTATMKLKTLVTWKKSYDQPRQHIQKQRHYFVNKGQFGRGYVFSSSHVQNENWTIKKAKH